MLELTEQITRGLSLIYESPKCNSLTHSLMVDDMTSRSWCNVLKV